MPTATDICPHHGLADARGVILPTIHCDDLLVCLIAEFERSGIAELSLVAPGFTLILQAGTEPRIEQGQ